MAAIWQHCVPRVADEDEEDEDGATMQPETSKRRRVSFGQVTVFVHEASLDASKLPRCCTTPHTPALAAARPPAFAMTRDLSCVTVMAWRQSAWVPLSGRS